MLSRATIRWKCAFTHINALSRKNLTDARAVNANDVSTPLDTGAAFGGITGIAPSRRMIVTCMWGVSDPLRARRGAKKGAAKWGSLTPRWSSSGSDSDAESGTGGTERRRRPAGGCSRARTSSIDGRQLRDARIDSPNESCATQGNGAPEFWFPDPVPPFECRHEQPGEERFARVIVAPTVARAASGTGEAAL